MASEISSPESATFVQALLQGQRIGAMHQLIANNVNFLTMCWWGNINQSYRMRDGLTSVRLFGQRTASQCGKASTLYVKKDQLT
jgi:hypothetical protein